MKLSKESIEQITAVANEGDSHAALMLAHAYRDGNGVEKDNFTAIEWLQKSANNSNWAANFELSMIFRKGLLDQKVDMTIAKYYLEEARRITEENQNQFDE